MNTRACESLGEILKTGIDVHRCAAAQALATVGSNTAVSILIPALLDEDPDVRVDAAEALASIGDPSVAEHLMKSLIGDPEPDVKKAALSALIAFGYAPVVPMLRKMAVSRDCDVDWDEDEFYSEGWDSWLDMQILAIKGLAMFGTNDAVPDVLGAMGDEMGQDVSEFGVAALARMGEDGALALDQLFPLSDPRLQRRIAEVVVRSDNPHVQPQIDTLLTDPSAKIREITLRGLTPADPRFEPLFADPSPKVRAAVVRRAGQSFPSLVKTLITDEDPGVRAEVFKIITANPDTYRDDTLAEAVKKAISGEPKAAKQAALALIALKGAGAFKGLTHVMTNKKVPLEFRVGAIEALETAGPVSAPHLLKAARDDERQMRLAAITALAGLAANDPVWPNAAGEGLIGALGGELILAPEEPDEAEETPETDIETEQAKLDTTEGDDAEPGDVIEQEREVDESTPLVAVLEAPAGSTLDQILSGGSADTPEVQPAEPVELSAQELRFLELAKQRKMSKRKMSLESDIAPYLDVRRFAASVLGGVPNSQVTSELIAVLNDDDQELRDEALNSLVQHGDTLGVLPQSAETPLLDLFAATKTDSTRVLALRALGKLSGNAVTTVLREALTDTDPLVRVEAVRALGDQGIADETIEAALRDSYIGVGIAAARSLAHNRGADAVNALIEFAFLNDGTYRRDIGQLLGTYAPDAGTDRLIEVLGDESLLRERLVAIDALAAVITTSAQTENLKVA